MAKDKKPPPDDRVAERGDAEEATSSMIVYDKDGRPVFVGHQVPPDIATPEEQVGEATGEDYDPTGGGDDGEEAA
jgi:hypothetical protein